jgi:hypothetical protein
MNGHDLTLCGLTETWRFDAVTIAVSLNNILRLLWDKITMKKWKILEAGISYNDLFPYAGKNGMLSSLLSYTFIERIIRYRSAHCD